MKEDAQLVAEVLAHGPAAFEPIVLRYQDAVFGTALARVGNFHDAEDIAQSVFVDAFTRLDRLKNPAGLGAWLRKIAIHKSIDHLRAKRENVDFEGIANDPKHAKQHSTLDGNDLRDQVLAAIGKLGKAQRETVTLFYINGYSIDEVAAMQEAPVGTVKRRLHEARNKLKEEMMKTVEGVLKSEAPKEDFGERVFEILSCFKRAEGLDDCLGGWGGIVSELRRIGSHGLDGFIRALESPHSPTRTFGAHLLGASSQKGEAVVELLKKAVKDQNRKVRRFSVEALMRIDARSERKMREFLPLVLPLLCDRSKRVRRAVAWGLCTWQKADTIPLEPVVQALVAEKDHVTRSYLMRLARVIAERPKSESGLDSEIGK